MADQNDLRKRLERIVFPTLFAALIAAGAFMALPLPASPVPLVLQNLLAVLAGLLLGPLQGAGAVLLFLILGALGFPVFSGGHGGLAWFAGPTGGYLVGYVLAALIAGLLARNRGKFRTFIGSVAGFASILVVGAIRLKFYKNLDWTSAFLVGILPFAIGDSIKAIAAFLLALRLGSFIDRIRDRSGFEKEEISE